MTTTIREPIPEEAAANPLSGRFGRKLLAGTSALGGSVAIERGLSFLASLFAARLGGAPVFGAYSLALTTANNIAAYTGSGIGNTATRFAGAHRRESREYGPVTRALLLVTTVSALLAAVLMFAAAGPLARHVLKNEGLTNLLRMSSVSAASIILLECCRGFLVGQRRHVALLLLSITCGAGLLAVLPAASLSGPEPMVLGHGLVILVAVVACVVFAGPLGLRPLSSGVSQQQPVGPVLREIWAFGMIQLASLLSMNIAGWWMTAQIARTDPSLIQIGLFAAAHQIRNMVALAPSMLSQSSYALMADGESMASNSAGAVVSMCTLAATAVSLVLAGMGMIVLPWVLPAVYGQSFAPAVLPATLALATAVAQMGAAPVSARLSIINVRRAGFINIVWAILVALAGTFFIYGNGAIAGSAIYLGAHLVSSWLVYFAVRDSGATPGLLMTLLVGQAGSCALVVLAFYRAAFIGSDWKISLAMAAVLALCLGLLALVVRQNRWLPSHLSLVSILTRFRRGSQ